MVNIATYDSPLGLIEIGYEGQHLCFIRRVDHIIRHEPSPLSDLANLQLQEYFLGTRREFQLPILPAGTAFQQAVWNSLLEIPYGEVRTYGEIADRIGKPGAARAVGQAANRNPLWIVIPCHRVVGKNGALTGYAGGLQMKQFLLNIEKDT